MLKKGQAGWIDNAKPILHRFVSPEGEIVRWPSVKKKPKNYGLEISWIGFNSVYKGQRVSWKHWYQTEGDRAYALAAFKKKPWAENRTIDLIERD